MKKSSNFAPGEMAEWSIAAVLKTVVPRGTGGSNPSFSAEYSKPPSEYWGFCFLLPYRCR